MQRPTKWAAEPALICYLTVIAGATAVGISVSLVLPSFGVDVSDPPFPTTLLVLAPPYEATVVGVTLLFARRAGAGAAALGLKRAPLTAMAMASIASLPLLLLAWGVSMAQEAVFGPDPRSALIVKGLLPRDPPQLLVAFIYSFLLIGLSQELFARGFVQRGLEGSLGRAKGLLAASALFGLMHGPGTPYAILPTFVLGLALGYVWQRTNGNTGVSAVMHGTYNSFFFALSYLFFGQG